MLNPGGNDIIVRLVLLEDQPHAFDIVLGIAPVTQGIEIAQFQMVLQTAGNAPGRQGNLPGDEIVPAPFRLVIEENAVAGKHAVCLAILPNHPVAVLLGNRIGRVGVERGILVLGHLFDLAVQLGGAGLIDAAGLVQTGGMHRLKNAKHTERIDLAGILGGIKADLDMALCRQIINLVGPNLYYNTHDTGRVRQITLVNHKTVQNAVNTACCGDRSPAYDPVYLIAFLQKKFCKIRAVLSGNAGNQCFFHGVIALLNS